MSLVTQLTDLITRIGTEIKTMKTTYSGNNTGNLTSLNTTAKANLLAAINEVNTLAVGKQANLGFTPENAANKGAASGYAGLDGAGKVPMAQLPDIVNKNKGFFATAAALSTAFPTATDGDYAVVGATDTVWLWDSGTTAWVETDKKGTVTSVNGSTGAVVIPVVTTLADGLMSATDKTSLNNHLTTHPAPTVRDARNQVAGSYEPAFTKNTGFNKNFGAALGDVCQGNDARLGDARTPTAHNQTASTISDFAAAVGAIAFTETEIGSITTDFVAAFNTAIA